MNARTQSNMGPEKRYKIVYYRNDPKFLDRYAWATGAEGLHCLPFRLHRLDILLRGRAT